MTKNITDNSIIRDGTRVAVLVDGGFYRKRVKHFSETSDPAGCATELEQYCRKHLTERYDAQLHRHELYRIFYYDCKPVSITVFNPITKKNEDLGKTSDFTWANEFFKALSRKRKFALRFGDISEKEIKYQLKEKAYKKLLNGSKSISDLTEEDQYMNITQKGVDMKIGIDIASMAYKKLVDQIILISGDSDFVPVAKLARREGIDFILDPMGMTPRPELLTHIDGLKSLKFPMLKNDEYSDEDDNNSGEYGFNANDTIWGKKTHRLNGRIRISIKMIPYDTFQCVIMLP